MNASAPNSYPYPAIQLNTGAYMPLLGLGTFLSAPLEVGKAVKCALEAGYRHIDCASVYGNEDEIGAALQEVFAEGKIKREDIFITSKLNARTMDPKGVAASLDKTLSDLKTSYVDLYLIHQPVPCQTVDGTAVPLRGIGWGLQDVWKQMEALYESGKAKAIGVSNFPVVLINDILCYGKVIPAMNQIERHPYLVQPKLVDFCRKNGIQITSFGSLGAPGLMGGKGNPELLKLDLVTSLAQKYGKTPAQILIRWSIDTNAVSIPKSVNPSRVKENFSVWDFKFTPEEIEALNGLDHGFRFFTQEWHTVPTFA